MVTYKGEECWTVEEVMDAMYFDSTDDLRRYIRQGMPRIVCKDGRSLFPKDRVHAWFRGDTGAKRSRTDRNIVILSWDKVKDLICEQGFTPYGFSKERGICYELLKRVRRGGKVRTSTAQKFAEALGAKIEDLQG